MTEKVLQVNYALRVTPEEYGQACAALAPALARLKGLRWKIWMIDETARTGGGIYLFDDQRSLDNFLSSELMASLKTHPALRDFTAKVFDVAGEASAITRAPVGAALAL